MNTHTRLISTLFLAALALPAVAGIELDTTAEIEVVTTDANGEQVVTRERATTVVPGTEVIYTISATNSGKSSADNVVVTNPVPQHTTYVDGSASGKGTDITFSVDGGQTFAKPDQLTVTGSDGESRAATAHDYTHLRWTWRTSLKPARQAPVSYRARVQ